MESGQRRQTMIEGGDPIEMQNNPYSYLISTMIRVRKKLQGLALCITSPRLCRGMVSVHGNTGLSTRFRLRENAGVRGQHDGVASSERPPKPSELLTPEEQQEQVLRLVDWFQQDKMDQVLCITGAGLSTESGIPDYRGSEGSYHRGHKPMVHDQFMTSEYQRKRYWGRGMVGWKSFHETKPNDGHLALAAMEAHGHIGVDLEDSADFYEEADDDLDWSFSSGHRRLALVTQNVDSLHRRAGSENFIELHGRGDQLRCVECGQRRDRNSFHRELESLNGKWLEAALEAVSNDQMRPDGDAALKEDNYDNLLVPPCTNCGGFMKTDVVFFGDVSDGRTCNKTREKQSLLDVS